MIFQKPLESWTITSPFGPRNVPGISAYHNGIDLRAAINTPVFAIADGKVFNSYYNELGGKQLLVDHADGYRSGFAHLTKSIVNNGDTVKKGQLIAYTGNTGASNAPHLHFTMKQNNIPLDPEKIDYEKKKDQSPWWPGIPLPEPSARNVGLVIIALIAFYLFSRK